MLRGLVPYRGASNARGEAAAFPKVAPSLPAGPPWTALWGPGVDFRSLRLPIGKPGEDISADLVAFVIGRDFKMHAPSRPNNQEDLPPRMRCAVEVSLTQVREGLNSKVSAAQSARHTCGLPPPRGATCRDRSPCAVLSGLGRARYSNAARLVAAGPGFS